ncbi:MAG TPA: phosphoribosylglycinamide formyltransferase [Chitinophagaceae bacterium]|nr:phosphoribosylglycinamide formyltransferase [Chitinophagaceae bacterium]
MLSGLQKKWKVNGGRLLLILLTFAIGGSATGYIGRKLLAFLDFDSPWIYIPVYIIVITLIWPLMVLIVSIPLGQFAFFLSYIKKLGRRITGKQPGIVQIAVFASGTGSNAQKIINHFRFHPLIKINLIVSNKPDAGVLNIAQHENIPILLIEKEKFFRGNAYADELKEMKIDFIVLAGFLWKIPFSLIEAYKNRIVNIHPALLPKYGGKGLYGNHVHEAVLKAGEKESGITIHYVDEQYDHGDHIFQEKVLVEEGDTPEILAKKIQRLEHAHFPKIIEQVVTKLR